MPLKGWIVTYETMIKDPKMDKQIKKIIDGQGDRQNNKSNVQAQMTEWVMQDEPGFKKLADIVKTMAIECSLKQYNRRI